MILALPSCTLNREAVAGASPIGTKTKTNAFGIKTKTIAQQL